MVRIAVDAFVVTSFVVDATSTPIQQVLTTDNPNHEASGAPSSALATTQNI